MLIINKIFKSSIGKKSVVAVSGIGMALFLVAHLAGNLLMFAGPDAMNAYGVGLREILKFGNISLGLWIARSGLVVIFVVHVISAIQLTLQNKKARPVAYYSENTVTASFASRTMIISGMLVLAFLIFHIAHYTLGIVDTPKVFHLKDHLQRHDVYNMVLKNFQNPMYSGLYIVTMLILAAHLIHGISSVFQTFGLIGKSGYGLVKKISLGFTLVVISGFISIPAAVLAGIIK